jgi:hypothetical protein
VRDFGLIDALERGLFVAREDDRWELALLVGREDSLCKGRLIALDGDIGRVTPSWWWLATLVGLDTGIL